MNWEVDWMWQLCTYLWRKNSTLTLMPRMKPQFLDLWDRSLITRATELSQFPITRQWVHKPGSFILSLCLTSDWCCDVCSSEEFCLRRHAVVFGVQEHSASMLWQEESFYRAQFSETSVLAIEVLGVTFQKTNCHVYCFSTSTIERNVTDVQLM